MTLASPLGKLRFRRGLLSWYDAQKRDLPWRRTRDPYRVWLSEIMLQQTRVSVVIEYYRRFLDRFPTVRKLAAAREPSVLAAWSGLGYYRRARMLHRAAKLIARNGGNFPSTAAELWQLPGIGRYTAAAIASIAFNEPIAVVDGNVERVLERIAGRQLAAAQAWRDAQSLLHRGRPGDFNQAMMELGATVCAPRNPNCRLCPVRAFCSSRGELIRAAGTSRQRKCEIAYELRRRSGSVFLVRRSPAASLMPGMWEIPQCALSSAAEDLLTLRHSITNTAYVVRVKRGSVGKRASGKWVPTSQLEVLPLTGLARKILRAAGITDPES